MAFFDEKELISDIKVLTGQRDEARKYCKELQQELATLRKELSDGEKEAELLQMST